VPARNAAPSPIGPWSEQPTGASVTVTSDITPEVIPVSHHQTVQSIYTAFGRQDMAAILAPLSEDILWEYAYASEVVPWLSPRRGKAGVVAFLQALGAGVRIEKFEVNAILADERCAVALIDLDAVVVSTGRRISERDEPHVWHFDAAGRVVRFRHASDTLQHWRAFAG
jgi:uncharacterized protein